MIRGVLFDMDGVLLDTERMGQMYFIRLCHELGYPGMDIPKFNRLLGVTRAENIRQLKEMLGDDFPGEYAMDTYREMLLSEGRAGRIPMKKGVEECITGLKARGIRIGLATSTPREVVEMYFEHLPVLASAFDGMVCGTEAARSKPAPDIYLEAARRVGVPIEECLGIEDSRAGLRSITDAGAGSVFVPDLLGYDDSMNGTVKYQIEHLGQLCGLIDRINLEARVK